MDSLADGRLPDPVDPASPPRRLARAAAIAVSVGLMSLLLGAIAARNAADPHHGAPRVPPDTFLTGWLLSLPVAALLLGGYVALGRRRLAHYERRAGFLPRDGRKALPPTGRKTLFRVEYGSREDQVCLMVGRWDYGASTGWRRARVVDCVWLQADDAVGIGEQRARLGALAERLEERFEDARFDGERERLLADEASADRRALEAQSHLFAEQLARDS